MKMENISGLQTDEQMKLLNTANDEFLNYHSLSSSVSLGSSESQLLSTQADYNPVQINGRKVFGPPRNWVGAPPSNACELFIKKIPKSYSEYVLINHFQRFGKIYEFRLMMDFNERNRGYGYVKYTNEEDAARAKEIMSHFYIKPGKLLEIHYSYNKCRLFVGNLPKNLTKDEIEKGFRESFPKLTGIVLHNRIIDGNMNRGFAFIDFPSHKDALEVKKLTTPGRIKKWGRDLKIVWANQERYIDPEITKNLTTLFVRNVHLSVNPKDLYNMLSAVVERDQIKKISKVREFAFIEFKSKSSAQKVLNLLQNTKLKGYTLSFEWALPPTENSAHSLKNTDYDVVLRLKCIANYWNFPIITFGRVFESINVQYAAIMLQNHLQIRVIFIEMNTNNSLDIHSRFCEVVVRIIDHNGGFPAMNYVIKVTDDIMHIVGHMDLYTATFIRADDIGTKICLYLDEIRDLCVSINYLTNYNQNQIIFMYENVLKMNPKNFAYLTNLKLPNDRIFGCLNPLYRKKPPLKYKINNTQIIFVLCNLYSLTNYIFPKSSPILYSINNYKNTANTTKILNNFNHLLKNQNKYSIIHLLPTRFVQSKNNELKFNTIYFGIKQHLLPIENRQNYFLLNNYAMNYTYLNRNNEQQKYYYFNYLYQIEDINSISI